MSIADKLTTVAENIPKVYEAGQQSEYDSFWDSLQDNGTRTAYWGGFAGWRNTAFKPKYPLNNVTTCNYMFYGAFVTTVPPITFMGSDISQAYAHTGQIVTIECMKLKEDGSQTFVQPFDSCAGLKNLTIEGTIGQNGFNVQWSTRLTYESLISIKNALADKSADTSGTTWVITVGNTNKAKYTETDLQEIKAKGWDVK